VSLDCAYGLGAVQAFNGPLAEIPPERRVSFEEFAKLLRISKAALYSRVRRDWYRQPTMILGVAYFDSTEVDYWVRVECRRRGLDPEMQSPVSGAHQALELSRVGSFNS
jgi:hypothetical protein